MHKRAMETQKEIIDMLIRNKMQKRLSHAYLFSGEPGTEKLGMALLFAMMLYCENDNMCGSCVSCKRILDFKHTNVLYIKPDGQSIKKEQILSLQEEFSKSSLESGPRIYIIDNIEKMTLSSANSLLKFIEEPLNELTYGILISENISAVIPTILSRCQVLNFKSVHIKDIQNYLFSKNYESELAIIASRITNSIRECEEYINGPLLANMINVVKQLGIIIKSHNQNALVYMHDFYSLIDDRENFALFLKILLVFMKDWLISLELNIDKKTLLIYIDMIIKMQHRLGFYVNHILMFELFLLKIDGGKK